MSVGLSREEMVDVLCNNLHFINNEKLVNGEITEEELHRFIEKERKRYMAMDMMQLRNLCFINCC